jgi:uncharacterized linocin/CFP29 family protein
MSEGKRPGGLTALAVINFIFGGFNVLGALGLMAMIALNNMAAEARAGDTNEQQQRMIQAWREIGSGVLYLMIAVAAFSALLLISSGIGYLKQKKFLGRTVGNVYAAFAIIGALFGAMAVTSDAGGGFNLGTILGLVYPVITLFLLNTTFKEDFVN